MLRLGGLILVEYHKCYLLVSYLIKFSIEGGPGAKGGLGGRGRGKWEGNGGQTVEIGGPLEWKNEC